MQVHREHLKYQFNNDQLADLAKESARASKLKKSIEERQKEVVAQFKADLAVQENVVNRLSTLIDNGYEYRDIECRIELGSPSTLQKTCYRTDTGEEVWVKLMTDQDRQFVLDLQQKAEAEEAANQPADPIITPPPYVPRLDEPGLVEAVVEMLDGMASGAPLAQAAVMGGTHQRKQRKPRDAKAEAAAGGSSEGEDVPF